MHDFPRNNLIHSWNVIYRVWWVVDLCMDTVKNAIHGSQSLMHCFGILITLWPNIWSQLFRFFFIYSDALYKCTKSMETDYHRGSTINTLTINLFRIEINEYLHMMSQYMMEMFIQLYLWIHAWWCDWIKIIPAPRLMHR